MEDRGRDLVILLLLGLLAVAVYGNYSTGRDLRRVCELTGPHDAMVRNPRTPREEIGNICVGHQPDD
jgi:hypothetical protein